MILQADLQTIIDLIGPAIEILGSLITVWQQMSDHLDSISNQIDLGQTIRGVALERAKLNNVVTGWKEMQAKGKRRMPTWRRVHTNVCLF